MPVFELRPYQIPAVEAIQRWVQYRKESGYLKAAGGAGKSVLIAALAEWCFDNNKRVIILARSEKLLVQNKAKFAEQYQPHIGIYCAGLGEKELSKPITIASIQSIAKKGSELNADIVIIDEIQNLHNNPDSDTQYWNFLKALGNPQVIGYTATDFRTSSGELKFGKCIYDIPIAPLMEQKFLTPPSNKVVGNPDLSNVQILRGDYNGKQLEDIYLEPNLLAKSIGILQRYTADRHSVLIFTQSREHGRILKMAMADNGMVAEFVDGEMDKDDVVNPIIEEFSERRIKYLINVALFVEGTDIPCIDCICIFLSTMSKGKFEQILFRGTRLYEGKTDFLALDLGGNFQRHGQLGSPYKEKSKKETDLQSNGKVCPACEEFAPSAARECPCCGFNFPAPEGSKVTHNDEPDFASDAIHNPLVTYEVHDVRYSEHVKRKNGGESRSLKVTYICPDATPYGNVAEWLGLRHDDEGKDAWMKNNIRRFYKKRGYELLAGHDFDIDQLLFCSQFLKKPSNITVNHAEAFPRITDYDFAEPPVVALTAQEINELLEDDVIEF